MDLGDVDQVVDHRTLLADITLQLRVNHILVYAFLKLISLSLRAVNDRRQVVWKSWVFSNISFVYHARRILIRADSSLFATSGTLRLGVVPAVSVLIDSETATSWYLFKEAVVFQCHS